MNTMRIYKFSTLGLAEAFTARCNKLYLVLLGDDDLYWVVSAADANQLMNQGYEIA